MGSPHFARVLSICQHRFPSSSRLTGTRAPTTVMLDPAMKPRDFSNLETAYGNADKIPSLLKSASQYPASGGSKEPYFSLWSSLWHQGDIYSCSVAVVPDLLNIANNAPTDRIQDSYHLAISILITDQKLGKKFDKYKGDSFNHAIDMVRPIGIRLLESTVDHSWKRVALAGISFSVNDYQLAKFIINSELELTCPSCEEML